MSDSTRRGFIKKSAIVLTGLGGFGYLAARNHAQAQTPNLDPRVNYPWQVDVDWRARLSLHLTQDNTVEQMITGDLLVTFERMLQRLRSEPGLEEIVLGLQESGGTVEQLDEALVIAADALRAANNKSGYTLRTYLDYATTPQEAWDSDVYVALDYVALFTCVPLLFVDPHDVTKFMTDYAEAFERFAGTRTLRTLFTTRCIDILDSEELAMFHAARDVGLIWCSPRTGTNRAMARRDAPAQTRIELASTSKGLTVNQTTADRGTRKRGPNHVRPIRKRVAEVPNGRRCINGQCHSGYQNDYCQEVDGVCNAMGT